MYWIQEIGEQNCVVGYVQLKALSETFQNGTTQIGCREIFLSNWLTHWLKLWVMSQVEKNHISMRKPIENYTIFKMNITVEEFIAIFESWKNGRT